MRGASVFGVLARGGLGSSARAAASTGLGNGAAAGRVSGGRRECARAKGQAHPARRDGFAGRGPGRGAAGAALALAVALAASLVGAGGVAHAQSPNNAPTVANPLQDQTANPGTMFSYRFPTNTFADADSDTLTYTATLEDDSVLPSWLSFTATTRTFSGTPRATDMGTVSVEVTANDNNGGTVSDSFNIEVRGVCERTQRVRAGIVDNVAGVSNCADVTSAHLAAITSLSLLRPIGVDITAEQAALRSGDFAGLSRLQMLNLGNISPRGSGRTMTLPTDIFDGLTALQQLDLRDNDIPSLPAGVFDDLAALQRLFLHRANVGAVAAAVFDRLTNLETLWLDITVSTLPAGIFDRLTALTNLRLAGNDSLGLTTIRSDIFDDLTSLERLNLRDHRLSTLPGGLFDNLADLELLNIIGNPISNLPAGLFDNLTGLTLLSLNENNLQTLPDDLFEELTGLQHLFIYGNPGTANFVPTALAGEDQAVTPGAAVTLDASASGGAWGTNVTYEWTQQSGTTVTLAGTDTATPSFTAPDAPGELEFQLSVIADAICTLLCNRGREPTTVLRTTDTMRVTVIPGVTLALAPGSIRESDDPATTGVAEHRTRVTATLESTSREDTTVTVSVAPVAPALAGDFALSENKVLTIPAGQTSSTGEVTITAVDNDTDAPDKQVTVRGEAENTIGVTGPADVTLPILDDELPPLVTLVLADDEIHEVDDPNTPAVERTSTTVSAQLSYPSTEATTVMVAPIANVLSVTGGTLTIPAGQTESTGSATLTAIDNLDFAVPPTSVSGTAQNPMGVRGPLPVALTILDDEEAPSGTLRLVDGSVPHEGRLEMYYAGQWGTICDDYWTLEDADVACRQLEYPGLSDGTIYRRAHFGQGEGPIHLDDVLCRGNETTLISCPRHRDIAVGTSNCRHSEDVGLRCALASPRIADAPVLSAAPGTDGRWGPGETFEVALTFSEAVTVETAGGTPNLEVRFGDTLKRRAAYASGSGTATLIFAYDLQSGDGTHATAHASGDSLVLGGGLIRGAVTRRDAILDHPGASIAGEAAETPPLTAEFSDLPDSHRGQGHPFKFHLRFSHEIKMSYVTVRDDLLSMRAQVDKARRLVQGSNKGWEITVSPVSEDDIVITLPATEDCASEVAVCTSDGQKLETGISAIVPGLPAVSVADTQVREGPGAVLEFAVTLSRALGPRKADLVSYRTVDGTARAGEDYAAQSGYIYFKHGETTRTVSVPVFDDAIDEGSETMRLELSDALGGGRHLRVGDGTAIGTILNDDPMPKAWIARFGRTVAEQVMETVEGRLDGAPEPGTRLTIAGRTVGAAEASAEGPDEREAEARLAEAAAWLRTEDVDGAPEPDTTALTAHELLTGTSFALTGGSEAHGFGSVWGGATVSRFNGREEDEDLRLDGEVTSTMLGADFATGRATAGLMLSHSRGEGGYRSDAGDGEVSSTLTGLYPYGRYRVSEDVSVWGVLGYGAGALTLTPEDRAPIEADMSLALAGAGLRNKVVTPGEDGGPGLAVTSDGFVVRTSTEAVPGELARAEAQVSRLRLGLEGSYLLTLGEGWLEPSLEIGMRHDGGDAETGFGADIGAGLAWSDPSAGVDAEVRARGLLTHEASGLRERGFAGSFAWDPNPSSERGLSLSLRHTVGGSSTGGVNALFGRRTLKGLAANEDDDDLDRRRLEADLGYGFAVLGERYTATPELGLGLTGDERELRLGWRLARAASGGGAFELDVEGRRLDRLDGGPGPDRELGVGLGWRLDDPGGGNPAWEARIEARRREPANDDEAPEQGVGLRVRARW